MTFRLLLLHEPHDIGSCRWLLVAEEDTIGNNSKLRHTRGANEAANARMVMLFMVASQWVHMTSAAIVGGD